MKFFLTLCLIFSFSSHAEVLLKDIGVIGLASHDLFTWDAENEVNLENGRFDLSTIFDYENGSRWQKGGNPKNSENAPVYTITMKLVQYYQAQLKTSKDKSISRKKTVSYFLKMIAESYERLIGLPFPSKGINGKVTNTEQATLRAMHDILPGKARLIGRKLRSEIVLTQLWSAKTFLNEQELDQEIKYFDGSYDSEYLKIWVPFKYINLKQVDGEFIKKHSHFSQKDMLAELALVGGGKISIQNLSFNSYLIDLFSKGICHHGNEWIDRDMIPCD